MHRVLVLLLVYSAGLGLSPLESDRVLFEGDYRLKDGEWEKSFVLGPKHQANGFYLNVEGIEEFAVLVNGVEATQVRSGKTPRTRIRTVELTDCNYLLKTGVNRIELVTPEQDKDFWVRVWVSDRAWYLSSFHAHTTYSDGRYSVHDLLQMVLSEGGRFYAITDHDTLGQCYDTAFHQVGNLQPIRGEEWTTDSGHANVLGLEGSQTVAHGPILQMIDDGTYRGGLVQINHPCDLDIGWDRYPILDPGIDAIEIFNSVTWFPPGDRMDSDAAAVAWWHELLAEGKTIAGVGNPDYHGVLPLEGVLKSCTRVFSHAAHIDTILKCLKLGRGMVCDAPDDTRLYLYADTNSNGSWDLVMGEHFRIPSGSRTVKFRLEVESADWTDVVYIFDKTGEIFSHILWTGGDYEHEWTRSFSSQECDFMRLELKAELGLDYEMCSNPIYVNHPDYETGPTEFVTAGIGWPDTLYVGQEDTLHILLRNTQGYSPYRFGLKAACDTGLFDITGWQTSGNGIGEIEHQASVEGYEMVEWRGGYTWQNRLSVGTTFDFWLTVKPKRTGRHPILFRSWADDRLFLVEEDPNSGSPGPENKYWYQRSVTVEALTGVAEQEQTLLRTLIQSVRPEPACDFTRILVQMGKHDRAARLQVFDRAGRRVQRFALSHLAPGMHSINWDLRGETGRQLGPGIYFIRLETRNRSEVKRLTIVR